MEMISIPLSPLMMYELAAAGAFDKQLSIARSRAERRQETCQAPDGAKRGRRSISDADNMAASSGGDVTGWQAGSRCLGDLGWLALPADPRSGYGRGRARSARPV